MKVIIEQEKYEEMLNDFILKELYKKRIDKAIAILEKYEVCYRPGELYLKDILLDILKGGDKE